MYECIHRCLCDITVFVHITAEDHHSITLNLRLIEVDSEVDRNKTKRKSLCNKKQLDALFILSFSHQSTSTCFGHICSPSSGGILYIYNKWHVLCFLVELSVGPKHAEID